MSELTVWAKGARLALGTCWVAALPVLGCSTTPDDGMNGSPVGQPFAGATAGAAALAGMGGGRRARRRARPGPMSARPARRAALPGWVQLARATAAAARAAQARAAWSRSR